MTQIATIGRKVHFYPGRDTDVHRVGEQPLDATVIYVYPRPDGGPQLVNLYVIDHVGIAQMQPQVRLIDDDARPPAEGCYAEWMPYQKQQAKLQTAAAGVDATESSSAASVEPSPNPAPAASIAESQADDANAPAPATASDPTQLCGFDAALQALKAGKAATRVAWGPKVFIYMVPAASYKAQTGIAKKVFGEDAMVPYMAYLAIKRADGQVCLFNPGVDSILADDWEISQ